MSYVKGTNRREYKMVCLDDYIKEDDKARAIDKIVEAIDLEKVGYKERERKNGSGRPEYDVRSMTKLYLLGIQNGINSGRKLESACRNDLRFRWIMEEKEPDANTINDFRKNNKEYLKKVFYEVNRMYIEIGILEIKEVSQDGFKIKASNSKDKNYTINKIVDRIKRKTKEIELDEESKRKLEEREKEAEKYLTELEKNEELEEIEKEIEEKKKKLKEYEEILKEMEEKQISQISLTDKESKLMKNNGKYEVAYNNQTAVDMKSHITVAIKTDNNPADVGSMKEIAEIIEKEYKEITVNATDKGYNSVSDMMESLEKGMIPQVTPQDKKTKEVELECEYEEAEITEEMKKSKKIEDIKKCIRAGEIPECYKEWIGEIKVEEKIIRTKEIEEEEETRRSEEIRESAIEKQIFERDIKRNIVYCPAGEILSQKSQLQNGKRKYCNKKACRECKNPCTTSKFKEVTLSKNQKVSIPKKSIAEKPRVIRRANEKIKKVVKLKLKLKEEILKKRMQTSEHSQGTMKTVDNYGSFRMRGKEKVSTEIAMYFTASNIRRVCNMIGVKEVIKRLEEKYLKKLAIEI